MSEEKETRQGCNWLQDIFGAANIHVVQKRVQDSSVPQTVYHIEADKIERLLAMPTTQLQEYLEYCEIACKLADYSHTGQYEGRGPVIEISADSLDGAVINRDDKQSQKMAYFKAALLNRAELSKEGKLHLHPQTKNHQRAREYRDWQQALEAMAGDAPAVESPLRQKRDNIPNARERKGWDFLLEVFPKATKWQLQNTFAGNEMPCFAIDLGRLSELEKGNLMRLTRCLDQCNIPHKLEEKMIDLDQGEFVERSQLLFIPMDALIARLEPVRQNWQQMKGIATLPARIPAPLPKIDASSAVSADYSKHSGFRWLADIFGNGHVTVVNLAGNDYYQISRSHAENMLGIDSGSILESIKSLGVLGISTDYTREGGKHMLELSAEQLDAVVSEDKEGVVLIKNKFLLLKRAAEVAARQAAESNVFPLVRPWGKGQGTAR